MTTATAKGYGDSGVDCSLARARPTPVASSERRTPGDCRCAHDTRNLWSATVYRFRIRTRYRRRSPISPLPSGPRSVRVRMISQLPGVRATKRTVHSGRPSLPVPRRAACVCRSIKESNELTRQVAALLCADPGMRMTSSSPIETVRVPPPRDPATDGTDPEVVAQPASIAPRSSNDRATRAGALRRLTVLPSYDTTSLTSESGCFDGPHTGHSAAGCNNTN